MLLPRNRRGFRRRIESWDHRGLDILNGRRGSMREMSHDSGRGQWRCNILMLKFDDVLLMMMTGERVTKGLLLIGDVVTWWIVGLN